MILFHSGHQKKTKFSLTKTINLKKNDRCNNQNINKKDFYNY